MFSKDDQWLEEVRRRHKNFDSYNRESKIDSLAGCAACPGTRRDTRKRSATSFLARLAKWQAA